MKRLKHFKFTLLMVAIILVIVLTPGDSVPSVGIPGIDKVVHLGMFFMLSLVYSIEYKVYTKKQSAPWKIILGGTLFALATEIMQLFAVMRSFDLKDIVADAVGVILGIIIFKVSIKYYRGGRYA